MADMLCKPPEDERRLELWLQHAAGLIIFKNAREYAINGIPANVDEECRNTAIKAIEDSLYGMMMIFDGVSGVLQGNGYTINLETKVNLAEQGSGKIIKSVDLLNGDGMCMGFHSWLENDFGKDQITE